MTWKRTVPGSLSAAVLLLFPGCYQASWDTGSAGRQEYDELGVIFTWVDADDGVRLLITPIGPNTPTPGWTTEKRRLGLVLTVDGTEVDFKNDASIAVAQGGPVLLSDRSWREIVVDRPKVDADGWSRPIELDHEKWKAIGGIEGVLGDSGPRSDAGRESGPAKRAR